MFDLFELQIDRDQRPDDVDKKPDRRTRAQRDVDRILFSTAFRRLGGVTQVVLAGEDGHLFHNRLTHSVKVAQLGRRIAEVLAKRIEKAEPSRRTELVELVRKGGGLDPEVVYAACLAHDLGHPPFGHMGESQLHRSCLAHGLPEGFEGNAQSFRIATRLAISEPGNGLNLTRATLNAVSKYPWRSDDTGAGKKFGCYEDDKDFLEFARRPMNLRPHTRTLEAEIMDWADDIAYSVHDVEEFFRAGLIPLDRLAARCGAFLSVLDMLDLAVDRVRKGVADGRPGIADLLADARAWCAETWGGQPSQDQMLAGLEHLREKAYGDYQDIDDLLKEASDGWWVPAWRQEPPKAADKPSREEWVTALAIPIAQAPFTRPYTGDDEDRGKLRQYTGILTSRYVQGPPDGSVEFGNWGDAVFVTENGLRIERRAQLEVALLKALTRIYVHRDPVVSAQQQGEGRIIKYLFNSFWLSLHAKHGAAEIFPKRVLAEAKAWAAKLADARRQTHSAAVDGNLPEGTEAIVKANLDRVQRESVRFVSDVIAGMTEAQAITTYQRLTGFDFGSINEGPVL